MKLALIRQRYTPYGGAERFVSRAIDALEKAGTQVTILTRRWDNQDRTALICDPFYLGSLWRDWGFARCVCSALAREPFDLVQSHERIACCDVYRAGDGVHREWLWQRRRKQGWVARFGVAVNPYHHYMLAAERRTLTNARLRAVICISKMVREEIREHFGVPDEKLHVIYPGIDLEAFHPRLRTLHRTERRIALGIADSELVLLFVGSGFARKGVDVLLRAVHRARTPCRVLVIGRDKHLVRYERLARALGLGAHVRFLGGQDDVRPYYACADALVMPTLYEPFGNANIEAMAMGLPVITSTKAGASEFIEAGVQGYVCDALDVGAFADAIDALKNPARCAQLGEMARVRAEAYGIQAMGAQLLRLYETLLGASAAVE